MFTTVHRASVVSLALSALLFTSALPLVARSQEEGQPTATAETADIATAEDVASTTVPAEPVSETLLNLYPVEGIPGGGEAGDFVVGPGKVDVTLQPGQSKTFEITVTNRTGKLHRFNITAQDAVGSQDTATPIVLLGDDRGPYSMKDFVSVPYRTFDLQHNQRARIPVTITIPPDAEPGGLYGSVLVDTVAVQSEAGDTGGTAPQSAIIAKIGTLFFITIPGTVEKDGGIKEFTTVPEKTFYQGGPINFGIVYENRGSMHLVPYGELRIRNMFNEEIGYVKLDPWFVLPKSLRLREVTWTRELLFGRYTATVAINRSYDDVIDEMSYTFWVLPWKPLVGVFVAVFVVFFFIRSFFRRFEFKRKR
jgi:hypothetical protein